MGFCQKLLSVIGLTSATYIILALIIYVFAAIYKKKYGKKLKDTFESCDQANESLETTSNEDQESFYDAKEGTEET